MSTPSNISKETIDLAERQIVEASKKIEYFTVDYSVEFLALKMRQEEFFIPDYQRDYTWKEPRRCRFIESLLMGLPIPFLFFWEDRKTGKLEIVDGSQRLRTIQQFLDNDLKLDGLDRLDQLNGLKFRDLPKSRQRKIGNRSIRGIILDEHADEESRFDMFDRINTGSKVANPSEIRRGALTGPFMDLINRLAMDDTFQRIAPVTPNKAKEREREELVTRFFAYSDGLEDYRDMVSSFIFKYVRKMNEKFLEEPSLSHSYEERFNKTMNFVGKTFPWGFRKAIKGKTSPRSRFEAIAIGSYHATNERPQLLRDPPDVSSWHNSKEFSNVTGADGANARKRLEGRINFVRNKLLEANGGRF